MEYAGDVVRTVVARHGMWMTWNMFLGLVPLALAVILFLRPGPADPRIARPPLASPAWWVGVALFVLFLPNAPYVLTDLVHLAEDADTGLFSRRVLMGVLVPLYMLFVFAGFEAYTLSLLCLRSFLSRIGRPMWILPAELTCHALCAAGIFMGRHLRFNSWDVLHDAYSVASTSARHLMGLQGVVFVVQMFVLITVLYAAFKLGNLGIARLVRLTWRALTRPAPTAAT